MGTRIVYGNSFSENGWPMVDTGSCQWVTVPGTNPPVSLQIQTGQPLQILRAFAADYNAYVEPLRDGDSACWTPTNSVATSNHLSATACDLDWNGHAFQVRGTFDAGQRQTIRELLDFYEDTVYWGGDWNSPVDEMHWQMGYNTYRNPHTQDFINRKIRADGYSTFRRGGAAAPGPAVNAAATLAAATGLDTARAAEILPAVLDGLRASDCGTVERIAMWLAQIGHESGSFVYTEEIDKTGRYAPYIGRTWIQITWASNYAQFSEWCFDKGLVDTPTYFVDYPVRLAELKWAGLGAAWYWTEARPDINELSDRRDLETVTLRINGGYNGLADRQNRYDRALGLGDRLLDLASSTAPTPEDEWEALMATEVESISIYATAGEPKIPLANLLQAIDAHGGHEPFTEARAKAGDPEALALVARTAAGNGKYGRAAFAVNQAKRVLAEIEASNPNVLKSYLASKGQ